MKTWANQAYILSTSDELIFKTYLMLSLSPFLAAAYTGCRATAFYLGY